MFPVVIYLSSIPSIGFAYGNVAKTWVISDTPAGFSTLPGLAFPLCNESSNILLILPSGFELYLGFVHQLVSPATGLSQPIQTTLVYCLDDAYIHWSLPAPTGIPK